ncbi:MAG TPA: lytic murein transglycosylase [Solirubrobacteraceae bacterium]|nr:lytic murein transglycosylase [Solirubrobacteraceae bacterium]
MRLLPGAVVLLLVAPAMSLGAEQDSTTTAGPPAGTSSTPAPEEPATPSVGATGERSPTPAGSGGQQPAPAPEVESGHAQTGTAGGPGGARGGAPGSMPGGATGGSGAGGILAAKALSKARAPSPATLTPSLPLTLESSISGVPAFFIESFRVPPFLLPIYQAAGTAYGIPWQVLAAINEVETDYGRDLSVSSAGAEGWMQFLPAEWSQYGVDANGDGFKDPYNPADAIFAAARYLRAAGGSTNIRAAVYSYNHSQAYVDSVLLRAQLLGGTPPQLLGAVTELTEARFPVHAPSHFSDGFATASAAARGSSQTLVGTTIYSQAGAPVIAVQDGTIVQIGDSPTLGRFVSLRDAYGNIYTYAQLGDLAPVYPVLVPRGHTSVSARIAKAAAAAEPVPSGPASAGAQARSPLSEAATVSSLALGAAARLESAPAFPSPPRSAARPVSTPRPQATPRAFSAGSDEVYLHPLRAGVQVIAGTVLGHVGEDVSVTADGPHMLFQIRPSGPQAPLIDPKPILDGWVALEDTSIFRARGENPFLATSPTVGQVLLESQRQLEPQVLHDPGVHLARCGRQAIEAGGVEKRVLATLEFLSVSGLKPTVAGLRCDGGSGHAPQEDLYASSREDSVELTAVNGIPIADHGGAGSIADVTVRRLLDLQGLVRPVRIVDALSYPGATNVFAQPRARDIYISFKPPSGSAAHAAAFGSALTANEWIRLIARLGEIPDPTVASAPSPAAIPDRPAEQGGEGGEAYGDG